MNFNQNNFEEGISNSARLFKNKDKFHKDLLIKTDKQKLSSNLEEK